jgi:hypothetical protein
MWANRQSRVLFVALVRALKERDLLTGENVRRIARDTPSLLGSLQGPGIRQLILNNR